MGTFSNSDLFLNHTFLTPNAQMSHRPFSGVLVSRCLNFSNKSYSLQVRSETRREMLRSQ